MADALSASRLPDLPNAGYSSPKEKFTSDWVMFFLRGIERNRPFLLEIVCDGVDKWRTVAGRMLSVRSGGRATAMTPELLDRMFTYMVLLAGPNPEQQRLKLEQMSQFAHVTSYDFRQRTKDTLQRSQAVDRDTLAAEAAKFGTGRRMILV